MPRDIVLPRSSRAMVRPGRMVGAALLMVSVPLRAEGRDASSSSSSEVAKLSAEPAFLETSRSDEPSVTLAFVTGAAMAAASLGIGGAIAVGADSDAAKGAGIYVAQAGLVVSPFVAHAMLGEWKRGVLLAVPPFAAALGMATVLAARPHTVTGGPAPYQYAFSTFMTLSVFSAMLGVSDVLSFHDRAGTRSIALFPDMSQERIGIRIGGKL